MSEPTTEAGRRLLDGIQQTSDRLDVALNALDYILAIEAEAYANGFADMKSACHDEKAEARAADAGQCHHTNLANDGRFCLNCRAILAEQKS